MELRRFAVNAEASGPTLITRVHVKKNVEETGRIPKRIRAQQKAKMQRLWEISDAEKASQVDDYSSSNESTWVVSRMKTSDSRPFATIKVGDTNVRMMIDTGSTCNLRSSLQTTHQKTTPTRSA